MSKKSTRADLACQALRQAIIEQALPPGTKLPEDELGKRFAMSRTLVRAALAQLQSEGLVDAPPRRTATTAKPTVEEAREVFEVRRLLERDVVRLVIERWKPEFGAELEGHVRCMAGRIPPTVPSRSIARSSPPCAGATRRPPQQ